MLIGSSCRNHGERSWPERSVCRHFGVADVVGAPPARPGTLPTVSVLWVSVARRAMDVSHALGQIWLAAAVTVFAHLRDLFERLAAPRVRLAVAGRHGVMAPLSFVAA